MVGSQTIDAHGGAKEKGVAQTGLSGCASVDTPVARATDGKLAREDTAASIGVKQERLQQLVVKHHDTHSREWRFGE